MQLDQITDPEDQYMSVWITNAFDSKNLGDGFLLDEVLRNAAIPESFSNDVVIVSNNPSSVQDLSGFASLHLRTIRTPHALSTRDIRAHAPQALRNLAGLSRTRRDELPDAMISMAGGYTSFQGLISALGYLNDHFAMIDLPRKYGVPAMMFPVSIGPIGGLVRRRVLHAYSKFDTILVRDDDTAAELGSLKNVLRVPDLAVQAIVSQFAQGQGLPDRSAADEITLIGRGLGVEFGDYASRLARVAQATGGVWRLQVPKDQSFYEANELPFLSGEVDYAEISKKSRAVVSVRLHGALMSVLNGVPAVHLSYDRKGGGAYGDLGLSEWLHDAASFDPAVVARQARELAEDPTPFFDRIAQSVGGLEAMIAAQTRRIDGFWASADAARRRR